MRLGQSEMRRASSLFPSPIKTILYNSVKAKKLCGKVWKTDLTFFFLWKTFLENLHDSVLLHQKHIKMHTFFPKIGKNRDNGIV